LCELGVETAAVTGATLGIIGGEHRSTVCATDEVSNRLEDLQLTFSEGPSVDAVRDGVAVLVPDLSDASDSRWPWYTPAALEAGARAVFVFPVQVGAIRLGSLALAPVLTPRRHSSGRWTTGRASEPRCIRRWGRRWWSWVWMPSRRLRCCVPTRSPPAGRSRRWRPTSWPSGCVWILTEWLSVGPMRRRLRPE
jgi:hypothetical protein